MMAYFPDVYPKGKGPPRDYFFNVLNTLHPDYLAQVMVHANKQRMTTEGERMQKESIQISDYWAEQLNSMPYLSRKCPYPNQDLICLLLLQRGTARRFIFSSQAPSRLKLTASARRFPSSAPSASTPSPRRRLRRLTIHLHKQKCTISPQQALPLSNIWLQPHQPKMPR